MRVLIVGNLGYVGPVVARHLRAAMPEAELIGYDSGLFAHCLTAASALPELALDAQHFGDVRELPPALLAGADAVVQLAAVSNDPMGNRFEAVTDAINRAASLRLATMARDAGVASYVFASSCSVYGFAEGGARREGDPVNPLTAYARSKIGTEEALGQMELGGMTATCLRFATACGMSERLRLDLVLNDFVAGAVSTGKVTVLSDGSPWRPLIDVADMARAIEWAIGRHAANGGALLAVNAGSDAWNYQVRELAEAVAAEVPGTAVSINTDAPPDKRSYRVDFSLFRELAPAHQPQVTLAASIRRLREGIGEMALDADFRNSRFIRLKVLDGHIAAGRLTPDLRWTGRAADLQHGGMKFHHTPLHGARTIELEKRGDDRGFFARMFCQDEFAKAGLVSSFVQMNNSLSAKKGTLRGFHYQLAPAAEVKVIRCVRGALWDAIIDLRPDSPTCCRWFGAELTAENRRMVYAPRGFAHAILTLTDDCEAIYIVSNEYAPKEERGVRFDDPKFAIEWPIAPVEISDKDRNWPDFDPEFHGTARLQGLL